MTHTPRPARRARRTVGAGLAACFVLIPLASGCSSDDKPTASTAVDTDADAEASATGARSSACRPVPPQGEALAWFPADLPLPAGSYPIQDVDAAAAPPTVPPSDTHRGLLAVHGSIDDFVSFINTQWTASGWTLGKGDSEEGEAEGGYRRGDFGGAYRVRDVYCDPTFVELLLVYGPGTTSSESS